MSSIHPDISIVGVPKSGTSSLHALLDSLPGICGSNPKETFFFVDADNPLGHGRPNFHRDGLAAYQKYFRHQKKGERTLDSTTHYFYQQTAIREFADAGTKVCVVLREPTARLVSYFQYVCLTRDAVKNKIDFDEFVSALLDGTVEKFRSNFTNDFEFWTLESSLRQGYYADFLAQWQQQVQPENLKVVLFEDLIRDQEKILGEIVEFIGLELPPEALRLHKDNETYKAKYPAINRIARKVASWVSSDRLKRPLRRLYLKLQKGGPVADLKSQYPESINLLRNHYAPHIEKFREASGISTDAWTSSAGQHTQNTHKD